MHPPAHARALYEAKEGGRDRYFVARDRVAPTDYVSRLGWEERIRTALAAAHPGRG